MKLSLKVQLIGGRNVSNKNAHLIRAVNKKPGCSVISPRIPDPKNYVETYRVVKDHWDEWENGKKTGRKKKGYSLIEVTHGMGGWGGVQKSVRNLVKCALLSAGGFGVGLDIYIDQGGGGK
jgi:hypothetical protein